MKTTFLLSLLTAAFLFSPTGRAAPQNILANPGFEEGTQNDAPPWAVGGWRGSDRATTDEHRSGRRSLQLQGGGDEDVINSFLQWVPIDQTGATQYRLKVWMKIPAATAESTQPGRVRWIFDNGPSAGLVTPIDNPDWNQIDNGPDGIVPVAGSRYLAFRTYANIGHLTAYVDDIELIAEPSGQPTYPGVTGTVKDPNGKPISGAIVFLKSSPEAQRFPTDATGNGGASRPTDDAGKYTVCTKDDGEYYVVAWKQGYGLSAEQKVTIAGGAALVAFNAVLTKSTSGRNLAISTAARPTAFADINVGRVDDPHYNLSYLFDGNNFTTRYLNKASEEPADQRWVYVDLDPVGKKTFSINEFVLYGRGITPETQGSLGGEGTPKKFTIEYTTKDPATETEAGWAANTAVTVVDAVATLGPSVMRLSNPITARAVRLHVDNTGDGPLAWFSPVEFQVNSDKLARGGITGVVKDATTGTPIAGARVVLFQPVHIQNDVDVYGIGTVVPFVVDQEVRNGTPYEFDQAKNTQQIAITDATGAYTLDADAGQIVRVSVSATGYPWTFVSIAPPDDGSPATQNFDLGKEFIVSGVVKDATGPIYNAVVQIGGAGSKYAVATGADGKYSLAIGAGSRELYADAVGRAGHVETINVAANVTKDITLTTQAEPGSLSADFETLGDWEIGHFNTNWVSISTRAAKLDVGQNVTPGGKSSVLVEDIKAVDNAGAELADPTFEMLQRPSGKRIAVAAGKSYNVYFKLKIENWVITDTTKDCVHYEIRWLDANGAVLDRIYSHPFWIFPQTFWQQYSVGHWAGSAGSVAQVRLSPPAGAAFLDLKIGWVRFPSSGDPDTNPPGTQLFVDDLVIDSFGAAPAGITNLKAVVTAAGKVKITFDGTGVIQENTGDLKAFTDTAIKNGDEIDPVNAARYYRAK